MVPLFLRFLALFLVFTSTVHANDARQTSQTTNQIYYKGSHNIKKVALTFDDGPDTEITPQILDILKKEKVRATFFVVGIRIKKNPHIFKRIIQEGHLIANHTWDHPILSTLPDHEIKRQIQKTNQLIEHLSGKHALFFRPPYGDTNHRVQRVLQKEGLITVKWNIDTKDWQGPSSQKIVHCVATRLVPESIILQHSSGNTQHLLRTVDALPKMIQLLKKKKYQLVTLDQLLHTSDYRDN